MGTIVLDPGHGGTKDIPDDSTANNATSASGILEKNITLDLARRVRWSLENGTGKARADQLGKTVRVVMTRDSDMNKSLGDRASVAAMEDADLFLSIHCNAFNGVARGTEAWVDRKYMQGVKVSSAGKIVTREGPGVPASGVRNVNVADDASFAAAIAQAAYGAMKAHDNKAALRSDNYSKAVHGEAYTPPAGVKMKGLGVLRDAKLGTSGNACRATLLELEFIDVPAVDQLLNGGDAATVRNEIAAALAVALVEAL